MSKKETSAKTASTAVAVIGSEAVVPNASAKQFVAKGMSNAALDIFKGFEDKSLPPIIKPAELAPGMVIMGVITAFSVYKSSNPPMESALLTLDILDVVDGKLAPIGMKAAMPVTTVIARALGTSAEKTTSADTQIMEIEANGYKGAILAMKYTGTGKERGDGRNRPHLWDIKVKKADGTVQHNVATLKK